MNEDIYDRVVKEANYMVETKETVRSIAESFGISKSTVHKDLRERLIDINQSLYENVDRILKEHLETRHIKGGDSTKMKYLKI